MPATLRAPGAAWAAFAAAAAVAGVLILVAADGSTFSGDELGLLFRLAELPPAEAAFDPPPGKYLIAAPTLLYAVVAGLFGADSYLPYRLLGLALTVLAAGLFMALARRRGGGRVALGGAILLLFLGSAWEVIAIPARVPGQLAVCAGLGALLALAGSGRRRDAIACALGTLAVLSHPIGLAFCLAAAVVVLGDESRRWPRAYVYVVPLAVYGLWSLTIADAPAQQAETSIGDAISFAAEGFVAIAAALTGLFRSPWTDQVDFLTTGAVIVALASVALGAVVVLRAGRPSAWLVGLLAALLFSLLAPALAPGGAGFFRVPEAPRYLYPGAVISLLVVVETVGLSRDSWPEGRRAVLALASLGAVVFVAALWSNVAQLEESAGAYTDESAVITAKLGAFDLAREGRSPEQAAAQQGVTLTESRGLLSLLRAFTGPDSGPNMGRSAPAYYVIADRYGSPADSVAELRAAPPEIRREAEIAFEAARPPGP